MNIHFNDNELFEQLKFNTVFEINVGSYMYNLTSQNSDIDTLHIYLESKENANCVLRTHHQLQYKNNNVDYLFTSLTQFINNILSGDSTINYEVLKTDYFRLKFPELYKAMNFENLEVAKSYLGMCRRDFKSIATYEEKNEKLHKKLYHFVRGVLFAESIIYDKKLFGEDSVILECNELLLNIKNMKISEKEFFEIRYAYFDLMQEYRELVDEKIKNKKNDISIYRNIDKAIFNIYYEYSELEVIDYKEYIYDALINNKFNYLQ